MNVKPGPFDPRPTPAAPAQRKLVIWIMWSALLVGVIETSVILILA